MSPELIGTVATGVGVLLGVWRLVEAVRRDLAVRIGDVRRDLTAQIAAVNTRIHNIFFTDRKPSQ